jgi:hypothetical protein
MDFWDCGNGALDFLKGSKYNKRDLGPQGPPGPKRTIKGIQVLKDLAVSRDQKEILEQLGFQRT